MNIGTGTPLAAVVDRFFGHILAGDPTQCTELWAEDGVLEFPFAPPGFPRRIEGKAAIAAHMNALPDLFRFSSFDSRCQIENAAGTEGFLEFTCTGEALQTRRPYNQHYVILLRLDGEGRIRLYRDFWNPLVVMEALADHDARTVLPAEAGE